MTLHLSQFAEGNPAQAPVLLVPGAFCHGKVWDHTFAPYFAAQGHPTFTLTFSAHGGHRFQHALKPVSWYTNDLRRSLDRLGQHTLIVAHSTGALHTLRVLMERDVIGAALLSPAPASGFGALIKHWYQHSLVDTAKWLSLAIEPRVRHLGAAPSGVYSDTVLFDEERYVNDQLNYESMLAMLQLLPKQDISADKILTPLHLYGAMGDAVVPHQMVEAFASELDSPYTCYEGLSHSFQAEAAWQDIADDISSWFTTLSQHTRTNNYHATSRLKI